MINTVTFIIYSGANDDTDRIDDLLNRMLTDNPSNVKKLDWEHDTDRNCYTTTVQAKTRDRKDYEAIIDKYFDLSIIEYAN